MRPHARKRMMDVAASDTVAQCYLTKLARRLGRVPYEADSRTWTAAYKFLKVAEVELTGYAISGAAAQKAGSGISG